MMKCRCDPYISPSLRKQYVGENQIERRRPSHGDPGVYWKHLDASVQMVFNLDTGVQIKIKLFRAIYCRLKSTWKWSTIATTVGGPVVFNEIDA